MRITPNMTSDSALFNIQNARARINKLNEQIASNKNILSLGDDPITLRNLMDLENIVKQSDQYTSNIDKSEIWLKVTDTTLDAMHDTVAAIRNVTGSVVGGIDNSEEGKRLRSIAISELREYQKQLVDLGNTQLGDQYIFGGFKDDTPPFTHPTTYNGDGEVRNIAITKSSSIGINITGEALLMGNGQYGNVNILKTLDDLITEIVNNTDPAKISDLAEDFDASTNQLNGAIGDVASKLIRLDSTRNLLARDKNTALGIISDKQNVDYAKAATEMNQEQMAFEAALSVTAKVSQLSLLDYI